jgi:hypothetical protein
MSSTRSELHRVAAHVLGRRRFDVSGHFGLRASPGGIATPAFGPEPEVVRIDGTTLVREVGTESSSVDLAGSTLAELAQFAEVDLGSEYSAGANTPPVGARHEPLRLDQDELAELVAWFDLGWRVLDTCTARLGEGWTSSTIQLWPEHFDVGTTVSRRDGPSINLGSSPGDAFSADPYVYVGPWGPERPGDAAFWNAPFGAYVTREVAPDASSALDFFRTALDLFTEA